MSPALRLGDATGDVAGRCLDCAGEGAGFVPFPARRAASGVFLEIMELCDFAGAAELARLRFRNVPDAGLVISRLQTPPPTMVAAARCRRSPALHLLTS